MYFPNGLWSPGPRVSIDESVVSFGNVECGKSSTGVMHIKNESDVATVFQVRADTFLSHGCLLPASITIKLDQCSHTVVKCTGTRYIKESYKLYYFSNPSLSPSLFPFSLPLSLPLSLLPPSLPPSLSSLLLPLYLPPSFPFLPSPPPSLSQLQLDSSGVFRADVLCKWLPARSSQTIILHFNPHKPIPYCKRVTCLVHHQVQDV